MTAPARRTLLAAAALLLLAAAAPAQYVVLHACDAKGPYFEAARKLARHHRTEHVMRIDLAKPEAILPALRKIEPEHVVVVLRPETLDVNVVRRMLVASAKVDDDPFVDFHLGYVTGATAKEAVAFVDNIVRASRKRLPARVGHAAVWGGERPCTSQESRYVTGGLSLPQRSLVFAAPDGKSGRDQAFLDEHLADLEGCGAIIMGGHGMPWEIGHGPQAEDVAKLSLFPAVVFNYACYTGVTRRWPERKYENGAYVHRMNEVEPDRSFALAVIRAGAVGYVAYVNPRPAGPELSIDFHECLSGRSLGETRRADQAKIVLGFLGYGEPGITVGDWPTGTRTSVREVDAVRHMMLEGATGGVLYGDPAYRPFPEAKDAGPLRVETERDGATLRIALAVSAREVYLWCADPFRKADADTRTMAMKAYARVELPEDFPAVTSVRVASATWGGKPIDTLPVVFAEEIDRGRRFLHVKPGWARERRSGALRIELVAGAGGAATPSDTPRETGAKSEDWLERAREVGAYVVEKRDELEGENVYAGTAGAALFLFDLHAATGEDRWLEPARRLLGRALLAADAPGLHVGVAGIGQVALDAYHATGKKTYLDRAVECARRLGPPVCTDVISGAAGTGFFLLNLHAATGHPEWLDEARALGRYLAKSAVREGDGVGWPIVPGRNAAVYLGFSHGAAGIGTFLIELHHATGEKEWREFAEGAARFVIAHAAKDGADGWKWTKLAPPRKEAWPVQWCHGSPGIGLFFLALRERLGGDTYAEAIERCLASVRREGRTARATGIFCHGTSGNAELFVETYRVLRDPRHLETAREFGRDLVGPEGARTSIEVGSRSYAYGPDFMTGAAGIGRFFLRLADPDRTGPALMVRPSGHR